MNDPRKPVSSAVKALTGAAVVVFALCVCCGPALAGRFVNLTETAVFPQGEGEVVQATAFSACRGPGHSIDTIEFQAGVEYGLINRLQVGFALPALIATRDQATRTTAVDGTALWGLYNFIDPVTQGWGFAAAALYGGAADTQTGELALLVEKPFDRWLLVYNGILGRSWARISALDDTNFMTHHLGASWHAARGLYFGVETDWLLEQTPDTGWETAERYLGPNLSFETGPLWITAAAHFEIEGGDFTPDQVYRAQVGLPF